MPSLGRGAGAGSGGAGEGGAAGDGAGALSGERACTYTVVWQTDPRDRVVMPNDSHVVIMTSSLSSDVPVGMPGVPCHSHVVPFLLLGSRELALWECTPRHLVAPGLVQLAPGLVHLLLFLCTCSCCPSTYSCSCARALVLRALILVPVHLQYPKPYTFVS